MYTFEMNSLMSWTGKLARINLTTQSVQIFDTPMKVVRNVIGGKGLGAYLLDKEMDPQLDPLHPDSAFIVATGPAQGLVPIAGRYCIVAKAPHTGIFMDSHVGGYLGPELKFAGFDALIVKGRSKNPSWIKVDDQDISIHEANDIWGSTTIQAEQYFRDIHSKKSRVLTIGPAGENLVRIACTASDSYRNAARGGIGMLLGSKNLKAISIHGTQQLEPPNPEGLKEVVRDINRRAKESRKNDHPITKVGTSWLVTAANNQDQLPTLNYQFGEWEEAPKITGSAIEEEFSDKILRKPCYRCSLACSFVIDSQFPWAENISIQHPEYESLGLLGSNLGISDIETLLHANHLCNIYGLDTISTGSTIGWLMECIERKAVPSKYLAEAIRFGDTEGVLELIPKIARKEGIGEILAEGVVRASEVFGGNTGEWAVHVKGLELPAWDPRGKLGLALSYITSNVGASHLRGWPQTNAIPDESAVPVIKSLIEQQDLKILKDSLIMCHFTHSITPGLSIEDTAKIFEGLTGIPSSVQSMRESAQKIWILSRNFNVKVWQGSTPRQETGLARRLMRDPLPSGPAKGMTSFVNDADFEKSLDEFYILRNCDVNGIPKIEEIEWLKVSE
ncbi:MAG: aldehyde ferredoxin oxidoreductase family protein [Candidatus Kariarchaeaceae archaeon]